MINCGVSFTKLDIQDGESSMEAIEINLSSMFTDRRDDIESHRQSAATIFERNRGCGAPLDRIEERFEFRVKGFLAGRWRLHDLDLWIH
jgi:hypothetical protein